MFGLAFAQRGLSANAGRDSAIPWRPSFSIAGHEGYLTSAFIRDVADRTLAHLVAEMPEIGTLSSRYARHNSIHVAIEICLGEVQRLNGI
jgi:hypothetical protein